MKKLCLIMVALVAVSGCAGDKAAQKPRVCPQVAILRPLDTIENVKDDKMLIAAARMDSVEGTCAYGKTGLDIQFTLAMRAVRGPALEGNSATMPFFVAIVDKDDAARSKGLMTASFTFEKDAKEAAHAENLHVFLPLLTSEDAAGHRVLMGFQLTKEQLGAEGGK